MTNTRRSSDSISSYYGNESMGGVALLERPLTANRAQTADFADHEQETVRQRRNMQNILNYDKLPSATAVIEEQVEVQEVKAEITLQEEDIRPTVTTMQFGDADIDTMRAEMRTQEKEKKQYRLSGKGKMAIVLYALTVVVILALIVLNTGVLSSLNNKNLQSAQALEEVSAQYNALNQEIETASADQTVIDYATNQLNMVKK